jgi:hypothetical protein
MASTLVALQTVTVGAGGLASITFSSIPQTYNDLVITASVRSSQSGTNPDGLGMQFNSDAGNNYTQRQLYGTGVSVGSSTSTQNFAYFGPVTAASNTANTFGSATVYIPNYTSNRYKSISVDNVTENNTSTADAGFRANIWNSTDAINSIRIYDFVTGNLVQYSTVTLYGVYNSPLDTAVEAPTIGTATAASTGANVAFTPSGTGAPATSYVATSSPGGITATGYTSPILVTGLTSGTAYTFTVKGQNPGGTGAASAASNSVTPYDGYESIATVYGSGSSTITFSSIPSTYTHLQVRAFARDTGTGAASNTFSRFNGDTGNNYTAHWLTGDGATASANNVLPWDVNLIANIPAASASANIFGVMIYDVLDYANTNKFKTVRSLTGNDRNGSGSIWLDSGLWRSTAAISSITFTTGTSFAAGSVFELYGIR